MLNLEYLHLSYCTSLEEVHDSLRCSRKLIELNLSDCESLERFPYVNVESLEYLNLRYCSSLKKFPEFIGIMKSELKIVMHHSGIREIPSSIILRQWSHLAELYLNDMNNLVSLPSSICEFKDLVKLHVSRCSKLETLPEGIGDLKKLEVLNASGTQISRPPPSIIQLIKLKFLTFAKKESEDRANFVFPQVNEGLCSLEYLNLIFCDLIDGGLPEDIGSLSSLKVLDLSGNNFEHLPQSTAQLGALEYLDLSGCKRLKELPEVVRQLDRIDADWSNDWLCNSLFQNISSLQPDISASDSLSLRVFTSCQRDKNIPCWFHHQVTGRSLSVYLRKNWYVSDNFLGFAVYSARRSNNDMTALFYYHGRPVTCIAQKIVLSNYYGGVNHFFLIPLTSLLDKFKENRKTPNDYECIKLSFSEELECGVRLLYKDEAEVHTGIRRSRYKGVWSCCFPLLQLFHTRPGL